MSGSFPRYKRKRLYREFVTAMVVETLQLLCGLTNKEAAREACQ
jgi:hypothetical protein